MSYRGKVVILGDAAVGKTSLLARYIDGNFFDEYKQTVGANFLIKEVDLSKIIDKMNIENKEFVEDIKKKGYALYFWDIGGQTDKLFVTEYYFMSAIGAMVVCNVVNEESFKNVEFWIKKLKELSGDIPFILVGNKTDLPNRIVSTEALQKIAEDNNTEFFETSAKLDENVEKAFESLSVKILNNIK